MPEHSSGLWIPLSLEDYWFTLLWAARNTFQDVESFERVTFPSGGTGFHPHKLHAQLPSRSWSALTWSLLTEAFSTKCLSTSRFGLQSPQRESIAFCERKGSGKTEVPLYINEPYCSMYFGNICITIVQQLKSHGRCKTGTEIALRRLVVYIPSMDLGDKSFSPTHPRDMVNLSHLRQ